MADRELYELVYPQPLWADAVKEGLFNCPDAGGWLRQLPTGALFIEDGFVAAVKRIGVYAAEQRRLGRVPALDDLLAAAVGEGL